MRSLFNKMFERKAKTIIECPYGVCPNCWGTQEYGDKVVEAMKDAEISFNNHIKRKSFIQQFVQDNITGSILQKYKDGMYCPACQTIYKNLPNP